MQHETSWPARIPLASQLLHFSEILLPGSPLGPDRPVGQCSQGNKSWYSFNNTVVLFWNRLCRHTPSFSRWMCLVTATRPATSTISAFLLFLLIRKIPHLRTQSPPLLFLFGFKELSGPFPFKNFLCLKKSLKGSQGSFIFCLLP